jgi:hypothetical protein
MVPTRDFRFASLHAPLGPPWKYTSGTRCTLPFRCQMIMAFAQVASRKSASPLAGEGARGALGVTGRANPNVTPSAARCGSPFYSPGFPESSADAATCTCWFRGGSLA